MIYGYTNQHTMWGLWIIVIGLCLVSAIYDLTERRIPNILTLPAWGAGLLFAGLHAGPEGFFISFAASIVAALPYLILFLFAGGGAGDVKLMAAVGAGVGFPGTLFVLAGVSLAAVVFALAWSLAHRQLGRVAGNLKRIGMSAASLALGKASRRDAAMLLPEGSAMVAMPYGVAIFLGVLASAAGVWLWAR